jgi:hypothetical protein
MLSSSGALVIAIKLKPKLSLQAAVLHSKKKFPSQKLHIFQRSITIYHLRTPEEVVLLSFPYH